MGKKEGKGIGECLEVRECPGQRVHINKVALSAGKSNCNAVSSINSFL